MDKKKTIIVWGIRNAQKRPRKGSKTTDFLGFGHPKCTEKPQKSSKNH